MKNTILILIGPKGSGKTHIGKTLEKHYNIDFYEVEKFWKNLKEQKNLTTEKEYFENIDEFVNEGNIVLLTNLENEVKNKNLIIESIGISPDIDNFLSSLKEFANVYLVKVYADKVNYLQRIKNRDKTNQIEISEDKIIELNKKAEKVDFNFDLEINNNDLKETDIISKFEKVFKT